MIIQEFSIILVSTLFGVNSSFGAIWCSYATLAFSHLIASQSQKTPLLRFVSPPLFLSICIFYSVCAHCFDNQFKTSPQSRLCESLSMLLRLSPCPPATMPCFSTIYHSLNQQFYSFATYSTALHLSFYAYIQHHNKQAEVALMLFLTQSSVTGSELTVVIPSFAR